MKVIFGAGGFAKETHLIFRRANQSKEANNRIECFVCADGDLLAGTQLKGVPVVTESEFFERYRDTTLDVYVAVADPAVRRKIVAKIRNWNLLVNFPRLIDPSVIMDFEDEAVILGEGVIIGIGSILETDILIGAFCQINMDCTVGHDSILGDFSTVSPGSHISGNVRLGNDVFCGAGVVIIEGVTVASNAVVGAGAVIVKDLNEPGTYLGVPAILRKNK